MKALFVGPSLHGQVLDHAGLDIRPPARQGDLWRAVEDGASAIGLVDGVFGFIPAVWHKEILFALSEGVTVLGGASMGALRAAECHSFGMIAVGAIADDFVTGRRDDDADVCLAHGPAELDYVPLSEPLVDVEATLAAMLAAGAIDALQSADLLRTARSTYFADRTLPELLRTVWPAGQLDDALALYEAHRVRLKQRDALELVERLHDLSETRTAPPGFKFVASEPWRHFLAAQTKV